VETEAITDAVVSHAMSLGIFEVVNQHEPKNKPGRGLTCAVWIQSIVPLPAASGLNRSSGRLLFNVRIYTNMLQEPQDAIDPEMIRAVDLLFQAYHEDFSLDGLVRNVDLLGQFGIPLTAQAGYLEQDKGLFRIITIQLPLIVNDLWEQTP
jgi:hypothetical protein